MSTRLACQVGHIAHILCSNCSIIRTTYALSSLNTEEKKRPSSPKQGSSNNGSSGSNGGNSAPPAGKPRSNSGSSSNEWGVRSFNRLFVRALDEFLDRLHGGTVCARGVYIFFFSCCHQLAVVRNGLLVCLNCFDLYCFAASVYRTRPGEPLHWRHRAPRAPPGHQHRQCWRRR